MTDISRTLGKHKKRDISVMAIPLDFTELTANGTYEVAKLPKNVAILETHLVSVVAFSSVKTVDIGFAGGAELVDGGLLDAAANTITAGEGPVAVQTAPVVTATMAGVGATPTAGHAVVLIQYIEYDKTTGELTDFAS